MIDNIARLELTPCRPRLALGGECQGVLMAWRSWGQESGPGRPPGVHFATGK